jgi:hypothetical protein
MFKELYLFHRWSLSLLLWLQHVQYGIFGEKSEEFSSYGMKAVSRYHVVSWTGVHVHFGLHWVQEEEDDWTLEDDDGYGSWILLLREIVLKNALM